MHLSVEGLRPWDWSYPVLQYLREWPTPTVIIFDMSTVVKSQRPTNHWLRAGAKLIPALYVLKVVDYDSTWNLYISFLDYNLSVWHDNYSAAQKTFVQDTGIWLGSETHGGEDVAIYASGPMAHLFQATQEQSYIAHVMMYASCVGDYTNEEHWITQNTSHSISLHDLKTRLILMSACLIVLAMWWNLHNNYYD